MKKNLQKFMAIIASLFAQSAYADVPAPWQMGFQDAASPIAEAMFGFHDFLLIVITVITVIVTLLLAYVMIRFRKKANPVPSKTSHNTLLEVLWTSIPIIILLAIAIPSFRLLYYVGEPKEAEMTLKVIGYQWYWGYQYPDQENIAFDSYMLPDDKAPEGLRLLAVDNEVVLPVDTVIKIQLTGADVIHSWAIPSLGMKLDAVPGRLNEMWLKIDKEGTYYGQCSELCGVGHGFMPIAVRAVSKDAFKEWAVEAKVKYGTL